MGDQRPLILTSLIPKALEQQHFAIQSWFEAGFEVWSLNIAEEFEFLKEYSGVKLVQANRDSRAITRKPLVYFDDMMKVLIKSERPIAGIVNSDIVLSCPDLVAKLHDHCSPNTLLFGCRVDVKNANEREGDIYPLGYDYFFYGLQARTFFESISSKFAIGAPWWDYWAVLVPKLKGVEVRSIIPPIGFHLVHPPAWEGGLFRSYGQECMDQLTKLGWFPELKEVALQDRGQIIAFANRCAEEILLESVPDCRFQSATTKLSLAQGHSPTLPKPGNRSEQYHKYITDLCGGYLSRCLSS